MRAHVRKWRPALRTIALALVVAAIPLPALAQEATRTTAPSSIRASAAKAAVTATLAPAQGQSTAAADDKAVLGSKSFFRTPAGIAVLGVVAAGVGYAVYSSGNDRIHSVIRKNQ